MLERSARQAALARGVIGLTVAGVGAYLLARAALVAITYDEAATWLRYGDASWLAIFDFEVATNHFLNTALSRLAAALAGPSEFVLRLPNLAGYALYAFYTWRLVARLSSGVIAAAAFVVLQVNPYVLDYFALSRGYGLSLGLLAGATWWWWRAIESILSGHSARPAVRRYSVLAGAAALANFSTLNAALALAGALVIVAVVSRRYAVVQNSARPAPPAGRTIWARRAAWVAAGVTFIALVWSQDARLATAQMYEPVLVRVAGIEGSDRAGIRVLRRDLRGRMLPVGRNDRGAWPIAPAVAVTGVRVEVPEAVADLAAIEVLIGDRQFFDTRPDDRRWTRRHDRGTVRFDSTAAVSLETSRLPSYRPVINWAGDAAHWRAVARATAGSVATLAVLFVLLQAVSWLSARLRVLPRDVSAPLATGAVGIAAAVGVPLSILSRNHELYFGRLDGLVENTYGSLIHTSLYRQQYVPDQEVWVLWSVFVAAGVSVLGCVVALIRRRATPAASGLALAGVVLLASIAAVTLHAWRGTPFPFGRTALYFFPFVALFLAFGADAVAGLSARARPIVAAAAAGLALFAVVHLVRAANLQSTFDWPMDASTKTMMADLRRVAVPAPGADAAVLGVDWVCYAGAAYYARRHPTPAIRVLTLPAAEPVQYVYVEPGSTPGVTVDPLMILRRYGAAGTVLAKSGQ